MIRVNIHDAKTRLSALLREVEEKGETIILQRHGRPVAEIHAYGSVDRATSVDRDLSPDPALVPVLNAGFNPAEPLADDEWPQDCR